MGLFQFRGLEEGQWIIAAPSPRYQKPSLEVEVKDNTIRELEWYVVIDKTKAAQSDFEITVEARKDTTNITERALSSDEIYYLPGSTGDVVKAVHFARDRSGTSRCRPADHPWDGARRLSLLH